MKCINCGQDPVLTPKNIRAQNKISSLTLALKNVIDVHILAKATSSLAFEKFLIDGGEQKMEAAEWAVVEAGEALKQAKKALASSIYHYETIYTKRSDKGRTKQMRQLPPIPNHKNQTILPSPRGNRGSHHRARSLDTKTPSHTATTSR